MTRHTAKYTIDEETRRSLGAQALNEAIKLGEVDKIGKLLNARPELVDIADRSGRTPLHVAAEYGKADALTLLAPLSTKIDATDVDGNTALNKALETNNEQEAVVLAVHGASGGIANRFGRTPFQTAFEKGFDAVILAFSPAEKVTFVIESYKELKDSNMGAAQQQQCLASLYTLASSFSPSGDDISMPQKYQFGVIAEKISSAHAALDPNAQQHTL